jgi:hypothetical protein
MTIQNTDKLIVGRGNDSYQVSFQDSGLAKKEYVDDFFVSKVGGDSMQGPLTIESIDPANGRATSKINTLGIFSNSSSSALRLGTTRDRLYVGHDDVSINGPLKVDEIQEKNVGTGITISSAANYEGNMDSDKNLVNKAYVDDAISNVQVDLTGYATETYVGNNFLGLNFNLLPTLS